MADIKDGDGVEVKGTAVKPYVLRNNGGIYSCSCPAWRNQSAPIEKRTCKHLKKFRGDAAEVARIGSAEQHSVPKSVSKAANAERDVQVLLASNSGSHIAPTGYRLLLALQHVTDHPAGLPSGQRRSFRQTWRCGEDNDGELRL
jgi:DNA ligase-1